MFKILKSIKNIFVHIRTSLKFIFLILIATTLIVGIISLFYRPMYSVTLNGEFIGYTTNKSKLQNRINEYIQNGDKNIAFIDIQSLPEYKLCLLKRENAEWYDIMLHDMAVVVVGGITWMNVRK